ncbi:MAG: EI24 domain-containing protein, partial [Pikeienuella sp.]
MITDFTKAISQLLDRRFIGVLVKSLGLTIGLLALITAALFYTLSFIPAIDFTVPFTDWHITLLDEVAKTASIGLILLFSSFLMFPVATIFIGLFLDEIADAVEAKHHPHLPTPRRQSLGEALTQGFEFMLTLIGANILALIVYLISGLAAPIVFWLVNGYLLGREYFEIVAARRMEPREAKSLRNRHLMSCWMAGALVAVPLSIPVVNLIVPLIGVAAFVH